MSAEVEVRDERQIQSQIVLFFVRILRRGDCNYSTLYLTHFDRQCPVPTATFCSVKAFLAKNDTLNGIHP